MSSKTVRCNVCGMPMMVPSNMRSVQCTECNNIIPVGSKDPLSVAQNAISCAANTLHDLLHTTSGNINRVLATYGSNPYGFGSQQARPFAQLPPVSAYGRKRAVLCGVSYYGQRHRLNGTVNDVVCMKYFLTQTGFPRESIIVLTEEESHPSLIPTKYNIRKALQWLVQGCQSGDSLVFHFSGHGSQQRGYSRDEMDGRDETLWPVDHHTEGTILDDEINATIVRPLPQGVKLHAIIDACHSGTVLDLPFACKMKRNGYYTWEDHGRRSATYKGTSGGLAVSLSACEDHQISVDTTALSGNTSTGALTYSFIQAAQNEPGLTYGRLLNSMRETIRDTKTNSLLPNGPIGSLLRNVLYKKSAQDPQLSSSEKFEIYTKQFIL